MRTNQDYKNAALARLRGNWTPAVIATLIYVVVAVICTGSMQLPTFFNNSTVAFSDMNPGAMLGFGGAGLLLSIFVLGPLEVGFSNANKLVYERRDYDVTRNMADLAMSNYLHKVWGMFLAGLKVALWTCLFFIPGIIMGFAYAMTPYILEEHPEIGAWEASTRSRDMMRGHKFDLFYLYLSFIGWILLAILTCGIGLLWLEPYMQGSVAAFYNDLKAEQGEAAVLE
ncbi:MAG: DUF975 family protein [Bacteroidales bacterium]|nr:DUF975 family protein [Bacteroidales bacterium]